MKNALFIVGGIFLVTLLTQSSVRGIRNNNLLNIKHNPINKWAGMVGVDNKGFVIFSDPIYSLRAGFRILTSYKNKGVNTLWDIIHRFAPPSENSTLNYINTIAQKTGIAPYAQLTPAQWPKIIQAMSAMEVGKTPALVDVLRAQQLAAA